MTFLSFLLGTGMLLWSGRGIARQVVPARDLRLSVAFPLGALVHALLLAMLALVGVDMHWWILLPVHALVGLLGSVLPPRLCPAPLVPPVAVAPARWERILRAACIALLAVQCGYAAVHALWLPTYHIDSLTNWTMRAKVSWLDGSLAFDETEARGVAKPQYPFAVHGVQTAAHVVAPAWSDRSANAATLLLTFSGFGALFLLLRRLRGTTVALAGVAAVTHIPLLGFHLAQGYGDIHLVTALLLALGFVLAARIADDARWYVGSALFVALSAWTKTEGLVVGLAPWALLLAIDLPFPRGRKERIVALAIGIGLSLSFPLFLLLKGLPLTPHATDGAIGFYPEAILPALAGFLSPSMGLAWPAILLAVVSVAWLWKTNDPRVDCRPIVTLGWGLLVLLIVLATYVFTPNARFLLNGESYFRQLMVPAALLIAALAGIVRGKNGTGSGRDVR